MEPGLDGSEESVVKFWRSRKKSHLEVLNALKMAEGERRTPFGNYGVVKVRTMDPRIMDFKDYRM